MQLHVQCQEKKTPRDNWFIITRTMKTTTRVSMFHYSFVITFTCYLKNKIRPNFLAFYVDIFLGLFGQNLNNNLLCTVSKEIPI